MPVRSFTRIILLSLVAAASALPAVAQEFESFATRQDSLFLRAYDRRDVKTYGVLLDEMIDRYNRLDSNEQKRVSGFLSTAYYNFACTYAMTGNTTAAIEYLQKAVGVGYTNYKHLLEDSDLLSLHNSPDFIALHASLRNEFDYRAILGRARAYDTLDTRPFPAFTYESKDDPNLAALRRGMRLDSIAGTCSDVLQILSLMHWVHNLIPHDGDKNNPPEMNAISLIKACAQEQRGLNCRGLATVLNECYLSLGFASRFVTCLPKDSLGIDQDCHVINMVYAPSLKKWIWIDPTNNVYVMNEKGELLGIEEVRDRIITGSPLILNPDANWNNRQPVTAAYYLGTYMAKNLYRLECPVNSTYNLETHADSKTVSYVELLPLEYFSQKPDVISRKGVSNGLLEYKTNNSKAFWQAPLR